MRGVGAPRIAPPPYAGLAVAKIIGQDENNVRLLFCIAGSRRCHHESRRYRHQQRGYQGSHFHIELLTVFFWRTRQTGSQRIKPILQRFLMRQTAQVLNHVGKVLLIADVRCDRAHPYCRLIILLGVTTPTLNKTVHLARDIPVAQDIEGWAPATADSLAPAARDKRNKSSHIATCRPEHFPDLRSSRVSSR